jgi:ribosomal protein L7Ae-like RNA K-turn-binding protein
MNKQKILQLLGLATRARMMISGEELVVNDVRKGKAKLVIIAEDASENTNKKLHDKCKSFNVDILVLGSRYELGHAIGKEERVVIAITDRGFAKKITSLFNEK